MPPKGNENNWARQPQRWFEARLQQWQTLERNNVQLEHDKAVPEALVSATVVAYPELARDLSIARRLAPKGQLTNNLERLYANTHRAIFRQPRRLRTNLTQLFRHEIPTVTKLLLPTILAVTLGFLLAGLIGWWLVDTYPELASLFASEAMIRTVQSGELWTDGLLNIIPSSLVSVQIFTNNILVSLTAMALGTLYGLGTIYIIGLNGLMLGGVFAFTAQYGLANRLFEFVCAHGFVELSIIAIAGAIGFHAGRALARPGHRSRLEAFQLAVRDGGKLMVLCVLFLIGAGLIEGYVSPNPDFSLNTRLIIGIGYWLLFVFALCGWRLPKFSGASDVR